MLAPAEPYSLHLLIYDPGKVLSGEITSWIQESDFFDELTTRELSTRDLVTLTPPKQPAVLFFVLPSGDLDDSFELLDQFTTMRDETPVVVIEPLTRAHIERQLLRLGAADSLFLHELTIELLDRSIRFITERAKARSIIRAKENRFRTLFENSPMAIFVLDPQWHFRTCNPAFEEFMGQEADALAGKNFRALVQPDYQLPIIDSELEKTGKLQAFRVELHLAENDVRFVRLAIARLPTLEEGYYQCFLEDITRVVYAERELQIAEKLSLTARMARTIAHEVRNPLTNIGLALDELRDTVAETEDSDMYFDIIDRNTSRIGKLVNDLLSSAKPTKLSLQPSNLNTVLEAALSLIVDRLTLKEVHLDKQLSDSLNEVMCDGNQLQVALLNLFTNAIEAMQDVGKPVLRVVTEATADGRAKITVADNGSGMDTETSNRLFDPFFTQKSGGMGLGLTSTRNIIRSHKGDISVKSEVGKGTTFTILL